MGHVSQVAHPKVKEAIFSLQLPPITDRGQGKRKPLVGGSRDHSRTALTARHVSRAPAASATMEWATWHAAHRVHALGGVGGRQFSL